MLGTYTGQVLESDSVSNSQVQPGTDWNET